MEARGPWPDCFVLQAGFHSHAWTTDAPPDLAVCCIVPSRLLAVLASRFLARYA